MYTPLDALLTRDEKRIQMDKAQHEIRSNLINQQSSYMDQRSSIKQSVAQMEQRQPYIQHAPMIDKRTLYDMKSATHLEQPRTDIMKQSVAQLEQQRTDHIRFQLEKQKQKQQEQQRASHIESINNQVRVIKDIYYSQKEKEKEQDGREHYREQDLGPAVNQLIDLLNSYTFTNTQLGRVADNISMSDYSLYAPLASPTFTGTVRLSPTVSFTSTPSPGTDTYTLSIDNSNNIIRTTSLSNYALTSSLSSYVTSNALLSTLSSYALVSSLSDYVLLTTLANYVTSGTLSNYVTSGTLSSYVTSTALSTSITTNALRINNVSTTGTQVGLLAYDSSGNVIKGTAPVPTQLHTTQVSSGTYYYPALVNWLATENKQYYTGTESMFYNFSTDTWTITTLLIGGTIRLQGGTGTYFNGSPSTQTPTFALGINDSNQIIKFLPSNQIGITTVLANNEYNLVFTNANITTSNGLLNIDEGLNMTYNPSTDRLTVPNLTVSGSASIAGYAPLASPALTGTPTAPTAASGTNTTQIATCAFVLANGTQLNSPAFTGTPTAPTPASGTNSTQIATTAFVQNAVNSSSSYLSLTGGTVSGNITVTGTLDVSGITTLGNFFKARTTEVGAKLGSMFDFSTAGTWDNSNAMFVTTGGMGGTNNGVGIGYNTTLGTGLLVSIAPNVAWRPMRYKAEQHQFFVNGNVSQAGVNQYGLYAENAGYFTNYTGAINAALGGVGSGDLVYYANSSGVHRFFSGGTQALVIAPASGTGLCFGTSGVGLQTITGSPYGNVSTYGNGPNSYNGYDINRRWCLMGQNANAEAGFHDNNNSWIWRTTGNNIIFDRPSVVYTALPQQTYTSFQILHGSNNSQIEWGVMYSQYFTYQGAWAAGGTVCGTFTKASTSSILRVSGYATNYISSNMNGRIIRFTNYNTGQSWDYYNYCYTNLGGNHVAYPIMVQTAAGLPTGTYYWYALNGGGLITDGNDFLYLLLEILPF
jgi:hypothetical protein